MPLAASNMIITTTESIEGYRIRNIQGLFAVSLCDNQLWVRVLKPI